MERTTTTLTHSPCAFIASISRNAFTSPIPNPSRCVSSMPKAKARSLKTHISQLSMKTNSKAKKPSKEKGESQEHDEEQEQDLGQDASKPKPIISLPSLGSEEFTEEKDEPRDKQGYTLRARLREETEAPFRKVRLFIYYASAASAALGGFIAGLRVIAALTGVQGTQPLKETVPNVLIDLAVVGVAFLLIRVDDKAGKKRLDRLSRGAKLAALKVEDHTKNVRKLSSFRSEKRPVIICGNVDTVNAVLAAASRLKKQLEKREIVIVPFVTGQGESVVFSSWEAGEWLAKPLIREEWTEWLSKELEASNTKMSKVKDDALVVIVRKDGRVGGRRISNQATLMWDNLIADIDRIEQQGGKDRYGKP